MNTQQHRRWTRAGDVVHVLGDQLDEDGDVVAAAGEPVLVAAVDGVLRRGLTVLAACGQVSLGRHATTGPAPVPVLAEPGPWWTTVEIVGEAYDVVDDAQLHRSVADAELERREIAAGRSGDFVVSDPLGLLWRARCVVCACPAEDDDFVFESWPLAAEAAADRGDWVIDHGTRRLWCPEHAPHDTTDRKDRDEREQPRGAAQMTITITSFGYGHGAAPELDVELDARPFRNPHHDPAMRQMTGHDEPVRRHVLATPGVADEVHAAVRRVRELVTTEPGREVRVGVGCVGGRHRSVAMATEIANAVAEDLAVRLVHRDVAKPVIQR